MFDILFPAWLAGMLLSLISAPLGAFVIWRKMSYFGDTLAHASLLGVALGFFLQINPYWTIIGVVIIVALILVLLENHTTFSMDTLLGIIAHTALSLGVIAVALMHNIRVDLMAYLFGDLLSIDYNDLYWIGAGVIIILTTLCLYWRELLSITVNDELAQIEGVNVAKVRLILMLITALTIALSMKFVGALIITSLLIIPAATARRLAKTPLSMVLIAVLMSFIAVSSGLLLSAFYDTPAGPSIVISAALIFVLSLLHKERY